MMLHVILHQLCQGGKFLSTIQVVVISCVLDFNVGDSAISPVQGGKKKKEKDAIWVPYIDFLSP